MRIVYADNINFYHIKRIRLMANTLGCFLQQTCTVEAGQGSSNNITLTMTILQAFHIAGFACNGCQQNWMLQ